MTPTRLKPGSKVEEKACKPTIPTETCVLIVVSKKKSIYIYGGTQQIYTVALFTAL